MSGRYCINNSIQSGVNPPIALSSTYLSIVMISSSTVPNITSPPTSPARRLRIYDIQFGTNGAPADAEIEFDVSRTTTFVGFTVDPTILDPADGQTASNWARNLGGEPAVTSNSSVLYMALNARATYSWLSAQGSELVIPAVNNSGLTFRARSSSYTGTTAACVHAIEE